MAACETYSASEARDNFSEVLDKALYKGPVLIKRRNQRFAVVPYELLAVLKEIEADDDASKAALAYEEYKQKGGFALEDVKRELGLE